MMQLKYITYITQEIFTYLSHLDTFPSFRSCNVGKFKELAFQHAGACLTLSRKIWDEWQKEDRVLGFLLLDGHSLGYWVLLILFLSNIVHS